MQGEDEKPLPRTKTRSREMKITKTEKYVLAAIIVIAVFLAISVRSLVGNVNNLIEKKEKEDKRLLNPLMI